jgi:hypothetical protein
MRSILGHSDEVESDQAADEVVEQCLQDLDGESPKAGLLFASVEYDHGPILRRILDRWPGLPLIGGSSDGELSSRLGFRHDSVLLTLLTGDELEASVGLGRDLSLDTDRATREALSTVETATARLCLTVFAPTANGSAVVRALDAGLPQGSPVFGGLSGDHRTFSHTREFFGAEVLTDSLPVLTLSGEFDFGWGLGSGWFPIGEEHEVTASDGHVVRSIDGRPAIEIYRQHYAVTSHGSLGEFPLAVYADGERDWMLRAMLGNDPESGAIRFAGEVPAGSRVRMTEVLPEGILSGSNDSLGAALSSFPGSRPELAVIFSCAARKWVLGTQAEQEAGRLGECASSCGQQDLPISGLYVFGEISPQPHGRSSRFHNETCVSLVLGSR